MHSNKISIVIKTKHYRPSEEQVQVQLTFSLSKETAWAQTLSQTSHAFKDDMEYTIKIFLP